VLKRTAKFDMTFVPYPGDSAAVNALLGDHVTSVFANFSSAAEQVKSGKLRALATTSRTRADALADVPTVAESSYKDYEADIWQGVVAPARTPKETISQLGRWFSAAVKAPDVQPKLATQGLHPAVVCGEDFAVHIRKQYDEYGRVIRELNIKAE